MGQTSVPAPRLELRGLRKYFASTGVLAVADVSLEVWPGEVVAIIGENGTGKSTLMNLLFGVHRRLISSLLIRIAWCLLRMLPFSGLRRLHNRLRRRCEALRGNGCRDGSRRNGFRHAATIEQRIVLLLNFRRAMSREEHVVWLRRHTARAVGDLLFIIHPLAGEEGFVGSRERLEEAGEGRAEGVVLVGKLLGGGDGEGGPNPQRARRAAESGREGALGQRL